MENTTWLECISCGFKADLFSERKFFCPKCDDLFDVHHKISSQPTSYWTNLFDKRLISPSINSGVWRFKEWIMPSLDESDIVSLGEGLVPIIPAGVNLGRWIGGFLDLYLILEGKCPTGSFKDFGMTVKVSVAKAIGILAEICASTGDTSASLAAYSGAAGISCAVVMPKGKITAEQILQAKLFGAKVVLLPGTFDESMNCLEELVRDYECYPGNSLNPARIEGHQATVFLTAQHFRWQLPDWFVVPIGNGSNCSSVGKALRLMKRLGFKVASRILGCQSIAANPLFLSWQKAGEENINIEEWEAAYKSVPVGETIATAMRIGEPVSYKKVIREIVSSSGAMAEATDDEARAGVLACARDGHFVCPQTGVALAGLRRAVKNGKIKPGEKVVVVSTADGLKFTAPFAASAGEIIEAPNCRAETVFHIING